MGIAKKIFFVIIKLGHLVIQMLPCLVALVFNLMNQVPFYYLKINPKITINSKMIMIKK